MDEGRQTQLAQKDVSPAQRHIIERPRLYRLLDEADARIILLCAPAGYGKTTLARQWVSKRGRKAFWYRAGAGSTDPVALAQGIVHAVAPEFPDAPKRLEEYLLGATAPDEAPDVLAEVLVESVIPWPPNAWLVVDDCQLFFGAGASEAVVERLLAVGEVHMILSSRVHPPWVSARDILYGRTFALGRDELSMNDGEANAVLAHSRNASDNVVGLANGWPAVIGLAAHLPTPAAPSAEMPLYHFFAQELFDTLDEATQENLPLLTLADTLDADVIEVLIPKVGAEVRREAVRVGLGSERSGTIEIHPLVRGFLQSKLDERPPPTGLVRRLAVFFIDIGNYDDAFTVIERYDLHDLLRTLIGKALREACRTGRNATVERWVTWGRTKGIDAPELALARAELLLNRGEWIAAEATASAAAPLLPTMTLAADAYLCAGGAAHLADRPTEAHAYFSKALKLDNGPDTVRRGVWGVFLSTMFDRRIAGGNAGALKALEAIPDATPAHLARLSQAHLIEAALEGNLAKAADAALQTEAILEDVLDPRVRSGFLNNLADALVMSSRYVEADRVARAEMHVAQRNRLEFVYPHALLNLASARLGLADFAGCAALLEQVAASSPPTESFVRANGLGISVRLHISRGNFEGLPDIEDVPGDARRDIQGEVLASIALGHAVCGRHERTRELLDAADKIRGFGLAPTRALIAIARLLVAIGSDDPSVHECVTALYETVTKTGVYDAVICATRAKPELLPFLMEYGSTHEIIQDAAARSGDASLRSALGLRETRKLSGPLSRRELEVLALAAQGFRNTDISARLFISPKTVKTHLQNIFQKLDARSRTEAVVRAKDAGLLD
ncbi:MAG: helix-turn-helix transcriptional regulator [Gaiellaceae bacterium]